MAETIGKFFNIFDGPATFFKGIQTILISKTKTSFNLY